MTEFDECVILSGLVGSRLYGTNDENSDTDLMQVFFDSPNAYLLGNERKSSQCSPGLSTELTKYEFRFFVKLCAAGNLNALPILWSPQNKLDYFGKLLVDNRHNFLSKKIYYAGTGYAQSCYNNMNKTGDNVETGKFGKKRKELVERFGYNTKAAMHALRLLRMTHEFLLDPAHDNLNFVRPDAEELRAIKDGKLKLDEVNLLFESTLKEVDKLAKKVDLLDNPPVECVDDFIIRAMRLYLLGLI